MKNFGNIKDSDKSLMHSKKGFTLSEILITLGVIGIVAVITIPLLVNSYQKHVYVTQLKKSYAEFSQMLQQIMRQSGGNDLVQAGFCDGGNNVAAAEFLKSNFNVAKDCGLNDSGCFPNSSVYSSYLNRATKRTSAIPGYKILTVNGTSVALNCYARSPIPAEAAKQPMASLYIDTNGVKNPNVAGRDFFRFYIWADGVIDEYAVYSTCRRGQENCTSGGSASAQREANFSAYCKDPNDADGCFGKLLNNNWTMDY